jgi:hypothetical protein
MMIEKAIALPRLAKALIAPLMGGRRRGAPFSAFELWPPTLFYAPVGLYWIWLALRHRSIGLPTAANPRIEAGGLCGESKVSILDQMGPEGRALTARYTSVLAAGADAAALAAAEAAIAAAGVVVPFVAKPDIGCKGTGVRVIRRPEDLAAYLAEFPKGARVIFQELVDEEGEAGVFYIRHPEGRRGHIVSVTLKQFPRVVGDGRSTLAELVRADPRAARLADLYLGRHTAHRDRVLAEGEPFRLVFVGNHCKGAVFKDGHHIVTSRMEAAFDRIARELPDFHFGRFDVRFRSLDDLRRGVGFRIIEVNGAGSEPTHIWDRHMALGDAYRTLFRNFRALFEIAAANRARGVRPLSARALFACYWRQRCLTRRYPRED